MFPEAEAATELLGQPLDALKRLGLLAGLEAGPQASSTIVCACMSVSEASIRQAIREHGLTSTAEIGARLGAGTNCGSCLPELKKLLALNVIETGVQA
jgi:assimilatory nitrate reductase catalytic subunit